METKRKISAWITRPKTLSYTQAYLRSLDKWWSSDHFLLAIYYGFDDEFENAVPENKKTNWNKKTASEFVQAVFSGKRRISFDEAFENIKELAIKGAFNFDFCLRAAYYLSCVEIWSLDVECNDPIMGYWSNPGKRRFGKNWPKKPKKLKKSA